MLIDWFTVGAQVLNFIILVWLMKRFLYKPVLHAIDTREKRIAKELADAKAKQAEAKAERDAFEQKNEAFDQERAARVKTMTAEVQANRKQLLDEARQAADALTAKRQAALASEARSLDQAVSRLARTEVFAIARKALADLADSSLEARLVTVFTQRLQALDGQAKAALAASLKKADTPALLRSAFALPKAQQAAVQQALDEAFSTHVELRFETAPEVISGIELTSNGQKLSWSLADYLAALEQDVSQLLDATTKPVPTAEQDPEPKPKPAPKPASKSPRQHKHVAAQDKS